MKKVAISNFFRSKVNSLDPSKYPDTKFHLCSIPAFDKGKPEELLGNEIGSSKKVLIEGDVVLSRLIPHIKRVWEIPILNENTVLGSGEWIVFNSTQVFGGYLRHFLQSELFHKQFMATVKGVGGSLLRADVSQTGKIEIPLPQLNTQQRIATILDEADTLCKKTQQLIDSYDELAQSIFLDMFGDPVKNPKGWKEKKIIEVCDHPKDIKCGPFGTQLQKSEYQDNGIPLWGIPQINSNFEKYPKEFVSEEKARQLDQYSVKPFDILMSRKGNVGKCAVYPSHFENGIMHSDVLRLRCGTKLSNPIFIAYQFKLNRKLITHVEQVSSGAIMAGINVSRLKDIFVQVPPISLQNQFAQKIDLIEQQKELTKQSLKESEDLFNTLLQKAFKGELEIK